MPRLRYRAKFHRGIWYVEDTHKPVKRNTGSPGLREGAVKYPGGVAARDSARHKNAEYAKENRKARAQGKKPIRSSNKKSWSWW